MVQLGEQDGQEVRVLGRHSRRDLGEGERKGVAQRHLALALRDHPRRQLQPRVRARRGGERAQEVRQRACLGCHLAHAVSRLE